MNEILYELRTKNGMSQEELAKKLGISRQTISHWENGKEKPAIDKYIALSDIFGVSIDYLVRGKDQDTCLNKQEQCGQNQEEGKSTKRLPLTDEVTWNIAKHNPDFKAEECVWIDGQAVKFMIALILHKGFESNCFNKDVTFYSIEKFIEQNDINKLNAHFDRLREYNYPQKKQWNALKRLPSENMEYVIAEAKRIIQLIDTTRLYPNAFEYFLLRMWEMKDKRTVKEGILKGYDPAEEMLCVNLYDTALNIILAVMAYGAFGEQGRHSKQPLVYLSNVITAHSRDRLTEIFAPFYRECPESQILVYWNGVVDKSQKDYDTALEIARVILDFFALNSINRNSCQRFYQRLKDIEKAYDLRHGQLAE